MLHAGLDIGSTSIKLALFTEGVIQIVKRVPFPKLKRNGPLATCDFTELSHALKDMIHHLDLLGKTITLGVTSQRSTFAQFDPQVGPKTIISWQDRRAHDWVQQHRQHHAEVKRITGLNLNAHYVGPKFASQADSEHHLGTMETIICKALGLKNGFCELSMAHRTLCLDPLSLDWSGPMLQLFGMQRSQLPKLWQNPHKISILKNITWTHTLADQAAAVAVLPMGSVGVNLGTGGFLMQPISTFDNRNPWLCGLIQPGLFALEAAINGISDLYEKDMPDIQNAPLCLPDHSGWGTPFWNPHGQRTFSHDGQSHLQSLAGREGIIFRILQLIENLPQTPEKVILTGGGANDPFITRGIATILDAPVFTLDIKQASLYGLGQKMGYNLNPTQETMVQSMPEFLYLRSKFGEWKSWIQTISNINPNVINH